ncbi:O-antigen ligase family protein [Bacillus salipaludis]|nr:O-antigen ligase family protein [Bacillus salipaludis]
MINNIKQIKGLFMYIFIVSFFTGPILGMVQYFRKEMFFNAPYFDSNRLVPINLFDPNYAMLPLIFTLVLNIFFLNNCKKRWNYILLLSTLLTILTAIFLTFSRSGIMVTVVIFLLYFWLFQIYNRIKMSSIFLSLIGIFVAIIIFSYLGIYDSYTNSSRINNVENVDTRVEQWKGALILWENSNLLLGLGKKDYINDLGQITGNFISTHNLYCQVLVQRGLLGILFLFSLIIYILHSLISIRRIAMKNNQLLFNISNILIMGLVGYLIMVFTLSDDIGFYLWFYLGITIALKSLVKKMKLEKQSGDILYD